MMTMRGQEGLAWMNHGVWCSRVVTAWEGGERIDRMKSVEAAHHNINQFRRQLVVRSTESEGMTHLD